MLDDKWPNYGCLVAFLLKFTEGYGEQLSAPLLRCRSNSQAEALKKECLRPCFTQSFVFNVNCNGLSFCFTLLFCHFSKLKIKPKTSDGFSLSFLHCRPRRLHQGPDRTKRWNKPSHQSDDRSWSHLSAFPSSLPGRMSQQWKPLQLQRKRFSVGLQWENDTSRGF